MIFTEDDAVDKKTTMNPQWDYILSSLQSIDPIKKAYFILENNTSSYIQCTGSNEKLCVELREVTENKFQHFVIGRVQNKNSFPVVWTIIHTKVGPIRVHQNEVLDITDAIMLFELFYQGKNLPNKYNQRNITRSFK
jgi:hypothetical protein